MGGGPFLFNFKFEIALVILLSHPLGLLIFGV